MARDTPKAVASPLARPARGRPRIDWAARTRGTILDAERYSRFVVIMKRVLPIAAGTVIMAVVAYSLIPRAADRIKISITSTGIIKDDLAMVKPRLTGADEKGNPFVITADNAIQDSKNVRRARLNNVEADMTLENSHWLNATAVRGLVDANAETLILDGGIALYSDSGYELHTAGADVDLRKGSVRGRGAVTGQGPMGTMTADHFKVDRVKREIQLYGNVHMTIFKGRQ